MKNRGMLLETIINKTIQSYADNDVAIIHKKNLDIKFASVENDAKLKNSYISKKSTVDYFGIYKGKFICFEAKSTNEDKIPWSNFKEHQHEYLLRIKKHNGIAFYIIFFKKFNEFFLVDPSLIFQETKKPIHIDFFRQKAILLDLVYPGYIDFLKYIKLV
ncbi:MAG: Holliday junction resolvase RecU [Metamycoplasmataceae bacterium]